MDKISFLNHYILVAIFLLLKMGIGISQTSYEYLHTGPEDNVPGKPLEDNNGNIILPIANNQNAKIIKIDSEGILIDSLTILNPVNGWCNLNTPVKLSNSTFMIIGGYSNDTVDYLWGAKFGYDLNQIDDFKIKVNGRIVSEYIYAITNKNGNIGIITPYFENQMFDQELLIMEIDQNGEQIREKYFKTLGNGIKKLFGLIQPDSNRYTFIKTGIINKKTTNLDYVDLDTSFSVNRESGIPWDMGKHNTIKQINDSVIITSGQKVFLDNNEFELGLIKTDMDYRLLDSIHFGKQDTVDYPGLHNNLDFIFYDQIFYAGISNLNMANPFYSTVPSWLMLQKLDEDLNLQWQKFYGGDACYNLWTVLATEDGGFVMAGTRYDHETQNEERDVYVLKVNENGNVGWSHNGPTRVSDFMVYPNPGSEVLHVRSTTQYKQFRFELYDMSGTRQLVEKVTNNKARINTAHLPAGAYVYRIYDEDSRMVESGKWVK